MADVEVGQEFGCWTVTDPLIITTKSNGYPRRMAECECICGHVRLVQISDLIDGSSKSCRRHNRGHLGPAPVGLIRPNQPAMGYDAYAQLDPYRLDDLYG